MTTTDILLIIIAVLLAIISIVLANILEAIQSFKLYRRKLTPEEKA